jgi:hypothetical protein
VAQDLLQELQSIRARAVTNLEAQHQKLLNDTLKTLETRVIQSVSELPIQDGVLFNTRLAIEIRPKLQQAIEELYLARVQTLINDYDKIAGTIVATYGKLPIPAEFKQITEADLVTIQQLKKIAFTQFQNLATEFTNTLAQEVFQSTLVGKPFAEVVQTIRDKINGIYQQADTVKQQQLVDFIQKQKIAGKTNSEDFKTAVDELKQTYGSTVTGANLAVYSSQIVQDALMGLPCFLIRVSGWKQAPITLTISPGGPFHALCIVFTEPSITYIIVTITATSFPIKSVIPIIIF